MFPKVHVLTSHRQTAWFPVGISLLLIRPWVRVDSCCLPPRCKYQFYTFGENLSCCSSLALQLSRKFDCFPLFTACLPPSGNVQTMSFGSDIAWILQVLCLKPVVSSAMGTYLQILRSNQRQHLLFMLWLSTHSGLITSQLIIISISWDGKQGGITRAKETTGCSEHVDNKLYRGSFSDRAHLMWGWKAI